MKLQIKMTAFGTSWQDRFQTVLQAVILCVVVSVTSLFCLAVV